MMIHLQQSSSANFEPFLQTLDPISLLLSFNNNLAALSQPENMERGPRYTAYAALRESKLRSNNKLYLLEDDNDEYPQLQLSKQLIPPVKKHVSFVSNVPRKKGTNACNVAQSVPDFSAVLRREKENRKPPRVDLTPPPGKGSGVLSKLEGSRSASSVVEKKKSRVGMMSARKSYASLDELKGLSSIAACAINGGGGGRFVRSMAARNVYGSRQL